MVRNEVEAGVRPLGPRSSPGGIIDDWAGLTGQGAPDGGLAAALTRCREVGRLNLPSSAMSTMRPPGGTGNADVEVVDMRIRVVSWNVDKPTGPWRERKRMACDGEADLALPPEAGRRPKRWWTGLTTRTGSMPARERTVWGGMEMLGLEWLGPQAPHGRPRRVRRTMCRETRRTWRRTTTQAGRRPR